MKLYLFKRESTSNVHINLKDSYTIYYAPSLEKFFGIAIRTVFSNPELFTSDEKEVINDFKHVLLNKNSKEYYNNDTKYSVIFQKEIEAEDAHITQLIKSIEQMHKYKQLVSTLYKKLVDTTEIYECIIFKIYDKIVDNYIWSSTAKKGNDISSIIRFPDVLTEQEAIDNVKNEMKKRNIEKYELKIEQMFKEKQQ